MALSKIDVANMLTGATPAANGGTGKTSTAGFIAQVVSGGATATQTSNSTSYVDCTNMTVAITPSATSSKILCIVHAGNVQCAAADADAVSFKILRATTSIYEVVNANFRTNDDEINSDHTFCVLDSPSSTSALTYKLQYKNRQSNNMSINATDSTNSSITVMEVLA